MTDEIKKITDERGQNYGHPKHHFLCTQSMYESWLVTRKSNEHLSYAREMAFRHGVYMILDKLSRMAKNPMHMDNLDDIQGYARCIKMILEDSEN